MRHHRELESRALRAALRTWAAKLARRDGAQRSISLVRARGATLQRERLARARSSRSSRARIARGERLRKLRGSSSPRAPCSCASTTASSAAAFCGAARWPPDERGVASACASHDAARGVEGEPARARGNGRDLWRWREAAAHDAVTASRGARRRREALRRDTMATGARRGQSESALGSWRRRAGLDRRRAPNDVACGGAACALFQSRRRGLTRGIDAWRFGMVEQHRARLALDAFANACARAVRRRDAREEARVWHPAPVVRAHAADAARTAHDEALAEGMRARTAVVEAAPPDTRRSPPRARARRAAAAGGSW